MIKCIFLDVDGTLTDGSIILDSNGNEFKSFNVKDGSIISKLLKMNYDIVIVTGRNSSVVDFRAKELGIKYVYQGIKDKNIIVKNQLKKMNYTHEDCLYIGDDDNDLDGMKLCKYTSCPNDSSENIKNYVDYISTLDGGKGVIRDVIDHYIKEGLIDVG